MLLVRISIVRGYKDQFIKIVCDCKIYQDNDKIFKVEVKRVIDK